MKYLLAILVILSLTSCLHKKTYQVEKSNNTKPVEKTIKEIYKDSIVSLSINNIVIGENFKKVIEIANKNRTISNIKRNIINDKQINYFGNINIYIKGSNNPIEARIEIYTFNDSISQVSVDVYSYDELKLIKTAYLEKYNKDACSEETLLDGYHKDDDYTEYEKIYITWDFKNQYIEIVEKLVVNKQVYVKNYKAKSVEEKYGIKKSYVFINSEINYIDNELYNKMNDYSKYLNNREIEIENEKRNKQKEEINRKAQQQDF